MFSNRSSLSNKLLVFVLTFTLTCESKADKKVLCEVLYEEGIQAYLENNFEKCIEKLENALEAYKTYIKTLIYCRMDCSDKTLQFTPLYSVDVDDLRFFEKTVRHTLCLIKCRKNDPELAEFKTIDPEIEKKFESQTPYEYLHICYFKENEHQKAASAAFTFLVSNPDNEAVRQSLKYYSTLPEVNMKEIVNYEAKDYVYHYAHGKNAYDRKNWKEVQDYMEESLASYYQSLEECRAMCEGPYDHRGWYPDFIPAIANHFTYVLKCRSRCPHKLNSLNGERHSDLLPSHYHYLQYAYFQEKQYRAACEAVASYLLFYPEDEVMQSNMQYYLNLPEVDDEFFTPRSEAARYIKRRIYEENILKFIKEEFSTDNLK